MARQRFICTSCDARIPEVSFCPSCGTPTAIASHDERILWEMGQWESKRPERSERSAATPEPRESIPLPRHREAAVEPAPERPAPPPPHERRGPVPRRPAAYNPAAANGNVPKATPAEPRATAKGIARNDAPTGETRRPFSPVPYRKAKRDHAQKPSSSPRHEVVGATEGAYALAPIEAEVEPVEFEKTSAPPAAASPSTRTPDRPGPPMPRARRSATTPAQAPAPRRQPERQIAPPPAVPALEDQHAEPGTLPPTDTRTFLHRAGRARHEPSSTGRAPHPETHATSGEIAPDASRVSRRTEKARARAAEVARKDAERAAEVARKEEARVAEVARKDAERAAREQAVADKALADAERAAAKTAAKQAAEAAKKAKHDAGRRKGRTEDQATPSKAQAREQAARAKEQTKLSKEQANLNERHAAEEDARARKQAKADAKNAKKHAKGEESRPAPAARAPEGQGVAAAEMAGGPKRSRRERRLERQAHKLGLVDGETVSVALEGTSQFGRATLLVTRFRVAIVPRSRRRTIHWIPLEEAQSIKHKRGSSNVKVDATVELLKFGSRRANALASLVDTLRSEVREARTNLARHHPQIVQEWMDRTADVWESDVGRLRLWARRHPALLLGVATLVLAPFAYLITSMIVR